MHADSGDHAPPVETAGLYCPNCDYDLTGLSEDRCPECGETFDRELLRKIAAGEPLPAVPWDTDQTIRGFMKTWWLALSDRGKLAGEFPPTHDRGNAMRYTFVCYHLSLIVFLAPVLALIPISGGDILPIHLIILSFVVLFCLWCFETLVACGLALFTPPRRVRNKYRFWRGLTHYTSGYSWLLAIWGASIVPVISYSEKPFWPLIVGFSGLGLLIWWAIGFWIMAWRRGESMLRIAASCASVVLAGCITLYIGIILFGLIAFNLGY